MQTTGLPLLQLLGGLCLVLLLIFTLYWAVKRLKSPLFGQSENIKVLSSLSLSFKEKLLWVEVGDTQVLLGLAPGRISHLLTKPAKKHFDKVLEKQATKGLKSHEIKHH